MNYTIIFTGLCLHLKWVLYRGNTAGSEKILGIILEFCLPHRLITVHSPNVSLHITFPKKILTVPTSQAYQVSNCQINLKQIRALVQYQGLLITSRMQIIKSHRQIREKSESSHVPPRSFLPSYPRHVLFNPEC